MKIKKIVAETIQEGKQKVLKELGEEAVILSTRAFKSIEHGGKMMQEIVAAIDESISKEPMNKTDVSGMQFLRNRESDNEPKSPMTFESAGEIFNELRSLKDMVSGLFDNMRFPYSGILGDKFGKIYKLLRNSDFSDEFALKFAGNLAVEYPQKSYNEIIILAKAKLTSGLKFSNPLNKESGQKIAGFIGSTGEGKTNSLIKLAVICKLVLSGNVLIISADTHKVGGSEQLQTFASIASIPFRAAYSPDELSDIISLEKDKDFIFIDTTGRSYTDKTHLKEIKEYIEKAKCTNVYLVESCKTNKSTFKKELDEFGKLGANDLILTKLDEAVTIGCAIEALYENDLPLNYFTTGQKIPDDIEPANKETISNLIFPDGTL